MSRVLVHHPCDAVSTNLSMLEIWGQIQEACGSWYAKWQYKAMMPVQANWICWKFSIGSGLLSTDHIHWREANMTENFWSSKSKVDWRQQIKQSGNVQLPDLHIYHLSTSCPNESAHIKMILYDDSLQQVVPWWCPVLHVPRRRSTPTTMSTMRSANSGSDDVCAFPKNKKKRHFDQSQRHPCTCWKSTSDHIRIIAFYCISTKTLQICAPQPADTRVEHRETAT